MFLLPSIVVGLGFAVLFGGRPSRLLDVRLRLGSMVFLSLLVQVVDFSRLGRGIPPEAAHALHLGSYALLIAFAVANLHVRALSLSLVGMVLNAVAIAANGGTMPLSHAAAREAGLHLGSTTNVSEAAPRLRFLGDVFALPGRLPFANTFSIGDVLIGVGIAAFIVVASLDREGERALEVRRIVRPLSARPYRVLVTGRLVSHLGDWLTLATLVGWTYETTGSTGNVAALMLARLAPPILGGGVAGVIVDRLPKGRLLLILELVRGAIVVGAIVSVLRGSVAGVLVALACSGALVAVSNAAASALIPALLPDEQLVAANAGIGIAKDAAMAAGALGAGVALVHVGAAAALAIDALTFAVAALLFTGLRGLGRAVESPRDRDEDDTRAWAGLVYLLRRRSLLLVVLSFAAATIATGLTNATLPRFLGGAEGLGGGAYGYGIAALAAGLAVGEGAIGLVRIGPRGGRWIGVGLVLMSGLFLLLALTAHAPTALLILAAIGFVDGTTDVLFSTVIQREAEPRYHGAAFGFSSALMTTTMMGAFAAAPLVNKLLAPSRVMLVASGFLVLAGSIGLLASRRPRRKPAPAVPAPLTRLRRLGSDLTVIAWGELVTVAEEAASAIAGSGIAAEVLDLGGREGWDPSAVLRTVEKTSKVMIVGNGGLDTELAALIVECAFEHLDAPVRRLAAPEPEELAERLRDLAAY